MNKLIIEDILIYENIYKLYTYYPVRLLDDTITIGNRARVI